MVELTSLTDLLDILKSIKDNTKETKTKMKSAIAINILRKFIWQATADSVSDPDTHPKRKNKKITQKEWDEYCADFEDYH